MLAPSVTRCGRVRKDGVPAGCGRGPGPAACVKRAAPESLPARLPAVTVPATLRPMADHRDRAPGARLLGMWERCRRLPLGPAVFAGLLGRVVPYSGTIGARVLELSPGHARLELRDRRVVRNHLRSIHAVALVNLGELASGLAMTTALPTGVRAIVVSLEIGFSKKARGTIVATSDVAVPPITAEIEHVVNAEMRDDTDEVVARVAVRWRIGPA